MLRPSFSYGVLFVICLLLLVRLTSNSQEMNALVRPWYKYRPDGQPGREITLIIPNVKAQGNITITMECEGKTETIKLPPVISADSISILLPPGAGVQKEAQVRITFRTATQQLYKTVIVPANKQWTVYIYPHAHVDIGYTALQETVQQLHVRNIDVGIDIAQKTQHYPAGARFLWNPEATWVAACYWQQANARQKKLFIEAVQKGWVQIDAAHSNINTSTCSDEELLHLFANSRRIAGITGVPVTTMVQMDVPGGSWGIVQAAAQNGIKGFISFPNYYDMRYTWENKPFYWIAPDGKNKLFFLQAVSYGAGYKLKGSKYGLDKIQSFNDSYDRVSTSQPLVNFIDPFIFEETAKLERGHSPYDIFAMTWSMADNCLIDADLPEAVKQWNELYAYPKLVIAGAKDIVAAYEKKYASIIPQYSGDFTEYWTDGLGSDARHVAMSRRAKEKLVQAETLWAMFNKTTPPPVDAFDTTWENLLLAAEHTWGYQNPAALIAKQVEQNKATYFENAEKQADELITRALQPVTKEGSSTIAVINTLSWPRNGLVTVTAAQSKAGDRVVDIENREVVSQRLTTGELVFEAQQVPALGSKVYRVVAGTITSAGDMIATSSLLKNKWITATLDQQTGNIASIKDNNNNHEWVNTASAYALNSYQHLAGVYNGKDEPGPVTTAYDVTVRVKERGPLITSLLITSKGTGCNWLTREVRVSRDQPVIECINTIDKTATRKKEGIHFGFAFNIPGGNMRVDIPWGIMMPEYDQLPGANRNWLAFQRWIDVSNNDYGITWTSIECPVVELGNITGNILDGARQHWRWIKNSQPTQTIISWPVNNHWDTNFPLQQEGMITSTYKILLHGPYDAVAANRFGVEQHRPLMAVPVADHPAGKPLVAIDNPRVMITALKKSDDNKSLVIHLRSVSEKPETVIVNWPAGSPRAIFYGMINERTMPKGVSAVNLLPFGMECVRVIL